MQNVRSPDHRVMFVQAIVFAPLCRFVTDRLQNHSVARAGRPKLLNGLRASATRNASVDVQSINCSEKQAKIPGNQKLG